jgi:hypothetical protein
MGRPSIASVTTRWVAFRHAHPGQHDFRRLEYDEGRGGVQRGHVDDLPALELGVQTHGPGRAEG